MITNELISEIKSKINDNHKQAITGDILQGVLVDMVKSLCEVYPQTYTDEEKAQARANIDALANYDGEITKEKLSAEVQAILDDVANKQNITDESLATIAKTIVGAINEVYKGGLDDASIATNKIKDGAITEPKLDTDLANVITSAVQPEELASAIATALASYVAKADIVDTTGSATDKVMSQYGVTETINGVTNKVTELDIIINGGEETTSLPIEYTAEDRYMSANYGGAIVTGSNMNVAFFPIQKGATLNIRVPKAGNAACYILGYTDKVDNHMNDGDVSEIADTIGTWAEFSRVITNAPNHKYLAVTYASGTTAPSVVQTIKKDPIVATKEELNILGNQLDAIEQITNKLNIEKLEEVEDAYDKTIDKFVSPNLYDKSKGLLGGYINQDGNVSPMDSKYYYSKPTPVQAGHYYLLAGRAIPEAQIIRCLNSSGDPLKVLIASTGQEHQSWYLPKEDGSSWTTNGQFKTPANAVSVQFNVVWNDSGNDDAIQLIDLGTEYHANPIAPQYQPYGEKTYKIKESALPDTNRMVDAPLLRNKRIFLFGASCASNSTQGVKGYGELIAEAAGIPYRGFVYDSADGNTKDVVMAAPNFTNYAKDGTCIRVISGRNDGVLPRIKRHVNADAEVDYVVLMFPANDAATQYTNMGQMEQSYTANFDTDTQLGALEEVCRYVTEIGRPLKFGCIIAWGITWVASDFYDAYIPVLQKWGIPFLDLRKSAGFDIKNCAAHRRLYSLTGDDYSSWDAATTYNLDAKVKYGGVLYKSTQDNNVGHVPTDTNYWMYVGSETGDGTHLNSAGNAIVAGKILSFIESL